MQNKKAPVLLFGIVVLALGGIFIWNAQSKPMSEEDLEHKNEEVKTRDLTAEDKKRSAEELMGKLAKTAPSGAPGEPGVKAAMTPGGPDETELENAKEPTILIEKSGGYKPTPNDSGTATHWYDHDSRSAKRAEEMAQSRG